MPKNNRERMIALADEFFGAKNDPDQISVTEDSMNRLRQLHPGTLTEESDEEGPLAWILVIPTTRELMEQFISGAINERELLEQTPIGVVYDSLYLCSALVLPEQRGRGLARRLLTRAINTIRQDHPISSLFFWSFSTAGERLAASAARETALPLFRRTTPTKK